MRTPKDELLLQAMDHALSSRTVEAVETLAGLYRLLDVERVAEDENYGVFATALSRRLEGATGALHPYRASELDGGAPQIDLFRQLMKHLPLASTADAVANTLLLEFLRGHDEATLLDVGIGQGRQECNLLRVLAKAGALPKHLSVVGVDPSGASLREAHGALRAVAEEVGLSLEFVGLESPVEDLDPAVWSALRSVRRPLVVNAAFALHHVVDGASEHVEPRDAVLASIASLGPVGVVLCEPNVDHHRAPARERLANAWHHFSRVFQLLDTLEVPAGDRRAIKRFFGREVDDIVGTVNERERCERHETALVWWERLRKAGFRPRGAMEAVCPSGVHPAVGLRAEEGTVGITFRSDVLVAVLAAVPGERS
ncbi:GAI protein2C [Corallococcus praedator]|uniref:GAI protein2C n=1 Tax=Corallococcus praedator TaxID=2316724 RepID=A0ABX9Q3M4_9BACT|nr:MULTISPECIES: GRAS family protein [Corallococcus]RKG99531.1 GAI protein2C [Corallococcus sp. CA047B]RKH22044.1 GAI protein2C [Corallococcus sp. CA031C]RKH88822.1 GAI protein2C [Corallococcus praedator]